MSESEFARKAAEHFTQPEGASFLGESIDSWRRTTRAELGLPTQRPLIMTGHQAGIWHAGIAEKFIVAHRIARDIDGAVVHVVVDHDTNDASLIAYPALSPTIEHGTITRFALDRSPRCTAPNALRKPVRIMRPERAHEVPALIEVQLKRIESAVRAHFGRENLALQMAHAANDLLAPHAIVDFTITATALAATTLARAIRANFAELRSAYNAVIRDERIATLAPDELPFWVLEPPATRRAFRDADRASEHELRIAPRALTLTAIARLAGCDLFIHGTGGAKYDIAMERWMSAVSGSPAPEILAPMIAATATRLAPLQQWAPTLDSIVTPSALHALQHDPFHDSGFTKRSLVSAIAGSPAAKRAAYQIMHQALKRERRVRTDEFAQLSARIAAHSTASSAAQLANDRTWPFPLSLSKDENRIKS